MWKSEFETEHGFEAFETMFRDTENSVAGHLDDLELQWFRAPVRSWNERFYEVQS